ncbi:sigma-54 dependent transcriptional regulator [Lutibacter sp.]|uniref:sigma-54-dependent transcriptional regulator n=1 Tax=Lutibacter sp. TaxID=1925666 RepID=UPI0025B82EA4|nr:sigma-54 dependent transcriptional regulator [Lutibacter sp.]MCF6182677.1 sigma-54 dependent transcriptional regulator [Lutibacter sp.]
MSEKLKIAVVDDERIIRITIADELRDKNYIVKEYANAQSVLIDYKDFLPDILITDIKMPGMDGIELLKKIKLLNTNITVIVMSAFGTVDVAVDAMKLGAFDYLTKPFNTDEIFILLDKIKEFTSIKEENKILRKRIEKKYDFSRFIGDEKINREIFKHIQIVANTNTSVLITGETGTGKELLTNIIHYNSNRINKPFVKVSCAILSKEIFESEMFGHIKGAFTGAEYDKIGRFELANEGTIYLDDIDDVPLELQVKLLRVLEEREIEKVGSSKSIPIDVRLIASTKRDLLELVKEGKFREDLYYRLKVFPIDLPPLRERRNDIEHLIYYYIDKFKNDKITIEKEVLKYLINYNWPGNIRELKNLIERLVLLATNGIISKDLLPLTITQPSIKNAFSNNLGQPLDKTVANLEISLISNALNVTNNNKTKAAKLLGLPISTLRTKMEKYGL